MLKPNPNPNPNMKTHHRPSPAAAGTQSNDMPVKQHAGVMRNNVIQKMRNVDVDSWSNNRYNQLTAQQKSRQHGITMIEITAGLVIIALLAVFLVPRVGALLGKSKVETAVQEITGLVNAAQLYRLVKGNFLLLDFDTLDNGGYHIEPFSANYKRNVYGKVIGLGALAADFLLIEYLMAGQESDCLQIAKRVDKLSSVTLHKDNSYADVGFLDGCSTEDGIFIKIGD